MPIRGFASDEIHPRRVEVRRMADAVRDLLEYQVRTDADPDLLAGMADQLEAIASRLREAPVRAYLEGYGESSTSGDPHAFFDDSPLLGHANPLAPPIDLEKFDDHIVGHVRFNSAYQGPPGCVHGGFVAAAFDEVLGVAQSLSGAPGMTARLTVDYRNPTPLHRDLRFVGRLDRVDGRKIYASGACYDGEELTAESEGLFVSMDQTKWLDMQEFFE